ncbi:hypothetical protein MKW98_021142 [Papaver atlanticum]|uniref:DNA helicase Pif1-like 2B domain-containing protein n=1 Tax=Papaver atlanticum TaxID=357466 RepID=A0AAD4XU01_9MAGN|nr:hypothetical protein MKW98_021142 [Papaver atlanticum]
MRIRNNNTDRVELRKIKEFGKWVLDLGDGKLPTTSIKEGDEPRWIKIRKDLLIQPLHDPVQQIVNITFPNMQQRLKDVNYLKSRCILTPNSECVDEVNSYIVSTIQSETRTYYSVDSISLTSEAVENQDDLFPVELLNSLKISGFPNQESELRAGVPIMLPINYNRSMGLCNGTRLILTKLAAWVIEAKMITRNDIAKKVLIHKIIMETNETKWPLKLRRKQFPIKVCFAMTINKSQGQTLEHVGVYLPKPVFCHAQLYVVVSRTTSREGLKFLIVNKEGEQEGYTQNIVDQEAFDNLP